MFGLFGQKSPASKSALSGQKPRRRRKAGLAPQKKRVPLAAKVCVVIVASCLIALVFTRSVDAVNETYGRLAAAFEGPSKHWDIQIVDGDGNPLSDEMRKEIYRLSSKYLRAEGSQDLAALLASIESVGSLEQVSVVRPRYQSVVITASTRKPAMLVHVSGKTRYLTQDATVYGEFLEETPHQSHSLVTLSGVFDPRSQPLMFDSSMRLIVTPEEKSLLLDGLNLSRITYKQSLDVKVINYQSYRGFALILGDSTEVVLGTAPFEYKLEKLLSILGKLKSQGSTASRIELDYDGKAFIKERKL